MTVIPSLQLDHQQCRQRQAWLTNELQQRNLDAAVFGQPEHVQYFSAFQPHRLMVGLFAIQADGTSLLVSPNEAPELVAADQVVTFPAQWRATLRQEQMEAACDTLREAWTGNSIDRVGVESSSSSHHLREVFGGRAEVVDLEKVLWRRRRAKDVDELRMIKRAIACTERMYHRAREIVEPGISELEVFNQLHAVAVEEAGEPLTALGNDYQSNSPGGPPRPRAAQAGELMILDLGPAYRGYYADNCRTLAVDGKPSDVQRAAWDTIVATLRMVEESVRPGVRCQDLFADAQAMLDQYREGSFFHHLGHGFGLYPHEAPHLNPNWNDVFEEGDVFTAEPGLYGPELRAGIRLEQNYRVTADGVELLTSFPLEL